MDNILTLIEAERYDDAASEMIQYLKVNEPDINSAIASATINMHFGMMGEAQQHIFAGLKLDPYNYELYMLLGDTYYSTNPNMAFLCYEHALYHASNTSKQQQISHKDISIIGDRIEEVRPYADIPGLEQIHLSTSAAASVCNKKIREAPNRDILLLPNGVYPTENAIFTLRLAMYSDSNIAICGCMSDSGPTYRVEDNIHSDTNFASTLSVPTAEIPEMRIYLSGFPLLIRRSAFDALGGYDDQFSFADFADHDFGMRILKAGYKAVLCHNSYVDTQGAYNEFCGDTYTALEVFRKKWNFSPEYYGNARGELLNFIKCPSNRAISVLEVGCGMGATLAKIKYLFPNAITYGMEIVNSVVELTPSELNIVAGNIESDPINNISNKSLDYIIFGDVLEHLHNPEEILIKMHQYLKEDGRIIISLPNLMNAAVIHNLLMGHFSYADSGILDRTHLKFFTYNEAIHMFFRAGYEVEEDAAMIVGPHSTKGEAHKEFFDALLELNGIADRIYFDIFQMHFLLKQRANE